jgi:thiosulfate/3-mercaptopyruvate sulfurtransferase
VNEEDVTLEELERRLGEVRVVDVRNAYEYDGSRGAACDPRQGHIPGAINLSVDDLLVMKVDEVGELVGLAEGDEVVVYCHGGSRSAFAAQVLRQLGFAARNYAGSWHEWSRSDLPIES